MSTARNELTNQLREAIINGDILKIDQILAAEPQLLSELKFRFIDFIMQKNSVALLDYFANRYQEIGLDIRDGIPKGWVCFQNFEMAKRLVEMGMLEKYELNNHKGITSLFKLECNYLWILDYYAKSLRVEALQFVIELCRNYKVDVKPYLFDLLNGVTEAQHTEENQDKLSAFNYLIKVCKEEDVPISSELERVKNLFEMCYHPDVLKSLLKSCVDVYYYHPEQNLAVIKQIIELYRTANVSLRPVLEYDSYNILFNALGNGDLPLVIFLLEVYAQEFKLEDILQRIMQGENTLGHCFRYLVIHPDSLEVLQYIVNLCDEKILSFDMTSLWMRQILLNERVLRTAIEFGNIKAIQYILAYCQKKCPQENLVSYIAPHICDIKDFDVTKFLLDYCQENNYEMTTEIYLKGFFRAARAENIPAFHFFAEICKQKGISLAKEVLGSNEDITELGIMSKSGTTGLLRVYLLQEDPNIFAGITQFDAATLSNLKSQAMKDLAYAEARIKYHDQIKFIRSLGVPRKSSYPPTEPMKVKRKKEQKEKADVIIKLILMMKGFTQVGVDGRPELPEELIYIIGEFVLGRELSFLRNAKRHLFFAGGFASLLSASKLVEVMEPNPGTPDQTKNV